MGDDNCGVLNITADQADDPAALPTSTRFHYGGVVLIDGEPLSLSDTTDEHAGFRFVGAEGEVIRTFPALDSDGPPLVPTPEAVERWQHLWWKVSEGAHDLAPTIVWVDARANAYFLIGNEVEETVFDDGSWLGPVLERPVVKEG